NADAVADRGAVALNQIQKTLVGIDDDGAGPFPAVVVDDLFQVARMDRLLARLAVIVLGRIDLTLKWLVARRSVVVAWAAEQQFEEPAAEIGALGESDRWALHVSNWMRAVNAWWTKVWRTEVWRIEIERAGDRGGESEARDDCGQDETLHGCTHST